MTKIFERTVFCEASHDGFFERRSHDVNEFGVCTHSEISESHDLCKEQLGRYSSNGDNCGHEEYNRDIEEIVNGLEG